MTVCFAFFTLACGLNVLALTLPNKVEEKFKDIARKGFHEELRESSQERINVLASSIDAYKMKHGHFPKSLKEVNKTVWITDNSYKLSEDVFDNPLYYYEVVDSSSYILLGIGRDGLPKTEDDILPQKITDSNRRLREKIDGIDKKKFNSLFPY